MSANLAGVLSRYDPRDECICGCWAERHTPCCGACLDCGNEICAEFDRINTAAEAAERDAEQSAPVGGLGS